MTNMEKVSELLIKRRQKDFYRKLMKEKKIILGEQDKTIYVRMQDILWPRIF